MRIYFSLVDEPFYLPACVEPLLERWGPSVVGAAFPDGFFDWKRIKTTMALYGPFKTAVRAARMALASRGGGVVHRQFIARGIPVRDVPDVNAPAFLDELRRLNVDVLVSINTPQKFKPEILALPALGCVNVHFGKLPRYRGILPIFYAVLHGESSFGVTVHMMDAKLDNGAIVAQRDVPIARGDSLDTLYPKGFAMAFELLDEALRAFDRGQVVLQPNAESDRTYHSHPTLRMIREYWQIVRR